jgi:hypothetical protein
VGNCLEQKIEASFTRRGQSDEIAHAWHSQRRRKKERETVEKLHPIYHQYCVKVHLGMHNILRLKP